MPPSRSPLPQFWTVLDRPLLYYTLKLFDAVPWLSEVVVAVSPERLEWAQEKARDVWMLKKTRFVVGGSDRHSSIAACLRALDPSRDVAGSDIIDTGAGGQARAAASSSASCSSNSGSGSAQAAPLSAHKTDRGDAASTRTAAVQPPPVDVVIVHDAVSVAGGYIAIAYCLCTIMSI